MKKYIIMLTCLILISFIIVSAEEAPKELPHVKIIINNEPKIFNFVPISETGNIMLQFKQYLTYLGVQDDSKHIIWNQTQKSVTVKHGSTVIYLKVNDKKALVNGKQFILPAAPTQYKGNVYIPAKFVAEALKKKVTGDDAYQAMYIAEEANYNQVKSIMDKVLVDTKALKDITYTVNYDLDVKLGGNIPIGLSETVEKHIGTDAIECDLIGEVTHYKLGNQTGFEAVESTMPLAEEGYYTKDYAYIKYKGYKWSKSEFTDGTTFSYSTEGGSKIPRSSQIVLNTINDFVGDIQYAGLKINNVQTTEGLTVLEGEVFSNYVFNKISSIIPSGKLGAQATVAMMFGGNVKSASFQTIITVDNKSSRVMKIEFIPQLVYEVASEGKPLYITLSGKITHNYTSYNSGLVLAVPKEVLESAANGELVKDYPASELITGRTASADYDRIEDLDTLAEVTAILGHGKKVSSQTTDYYTWGNVSAGTYIEVSFEDGKVQGMGCMNNYQEDKYEKIKFNLSFDEVVSILGQGEKSKTEVTDCYEWKYSDGETILVMVNGDKVVGKSKY